MSKIRSREEPRRTRLKEEKPYVYEKIMKFDEKVKRGESIAIVQMQYNYQCNMVCQHCSIAKLRRQKIGGRRILTPEVVGDISRQADAMGLARWEINGGEPFVAKDYDNMVRAIDPQKFYINSVTNGWLLNDKLAKHIKELGVDRIQVSIDSLDPAAHDLFRLKKGSHARALKAVFAARNAGLAVFVSTVVTKARLYSSEFIEFIEYFNSQGIDIFMSFAKPVGEWEGHFEELLNDGDLKYVQELEKEHMIFSHLTSMHGLKLGCLAVKGMFCITQYGDVLPCQYIFISLGNIFEQPLKDIIQTGLNIKYFGKYCENCLIANDMDFINNYIVPTYGKQLPVPWKEVFSKEDLIDGSRC